MTKRNTDLLSNRDMYVKYANVVEIARNAKIEIKHYGGTNCVTYHGKNLVDGRHFFKILSATPNVKGIEKFVGIIHELSHVLFQSPFNGSRNLIADVWKCKDERYQLFHNAFNVIEDQRIESQMGKIYLKHAGRFNKTTKKLGTLMRDDVLKDNPVNMLLAIRFQRGDDIKHMKDYDVYEKALKDVLLTDKYGGLRVLVSLKPYIDKWLDDKESKIEENKNNLSKESKEENKILNNDTQDTRWRYQSERKEDTGDDRHDLPDDVKELSTKDEIEAKIKESKKNGENDVSDIFTSLRDDGDNKKLPKNIRLVNRPECPVDTDYKISNGLSKLFRTIMMRNNDFIDNDGDEVDVESYIERVISGTDIGKCRVNQKISHGVSIVLSIDGSHSMDGIKIKTARKLVSTIFESIKGIDNVDVKANVWGGSIEGWTGINEINNISDIKNITTDTKDGHSYFSTPIHMGLEYSATMLKHMKGSKKMMIIITDGYPNHYNAGFHLSWKTYSVACKKSLVKAKNVTPNIMCIVVQDDSEYSGNPVKTLFKGSKLMHVHNMEGASEKVIKQFKHMIMSNLVR